MNAQRPVVAAVICLSLVPVTRQTSAHEHTARDFERAEALAHARAARQSEPAPRVEKGEKFCRLTIELTMSKTKEPVAGLTVIWTWG
jgi:hypothetical protein